MIAKKKFIISFNYFFQYVTGRISKKFHFWKIPNFSENSPSDGGNLVILIHNINLVPHKSLMHHDSQKFILYHNLHLFIPICDSEGFWNFFTFEEVTNFLLTFRALAPSSLDLYGLSITPLYLKILGLETPCQTWLSQNFWPFGLFLFQLSLRE
jgi:hypothetical protein